MAETVYEQNERRNRLLKRAMDKLGKPDLSALQLRDRLKQSPVKTKSNGIMTKRVVSQKTARHRPQKLERVVRKNEPFLLLKDAPTIGGRSSILYPTPEWFNFRGKADVSVIIPLYKSQEVVIDLINSWDLVNDGLLIEIIFVDDNCPNNSKDAVIRAWEARRSSLSNGIGKIIFNTENKGYGGACNTGGEYATGEYLIHLNADTRVTKGWVKPIVDLFKSDANIGIIGNLQLKDGGAWHGTIDSAGSEWTWQSNSFLHIGRHSYKQTNLVRPWEPEVAPKDVMKVAEREMVTGCCLAIPAKLNKFLGGYNTNYRIGYWEDSDICLTVREKGYKVMFQPNSVIWHKLSHSGSGGHKFQSFNQIFFENKWVNSGRIHPLVEDRRKRPTVEKILIQRKGAHGDVLVAGYVASALKKKYPRCEITFYTECPQVLEDNPSIDKVFSGGIPEKHYDVIYNLDLVYEYRPYANILETYADAVGVRQSDCTPFIHVNKYRNLPAKYVVIHAGKTAWAGRDWDKFEELSNRIIDSGKQVVCVGREGDQKVPCHLDLRGKTTIAQLASVIEQAELFVGIDSLPMHVAQAVNTLGVCFFGCVQPEFRIYRNNMKGVTAHNLACLGCHHRRPVPSVVTNTCETKNLECISLVTLDQFWAEIQRVLVHA